MALSLNEVLGTPNSNSYVAEAAPLALNPLIDTSSWNQGQPNNLVKKSAIKNPNALTDSIINLGQGALKLPGEVAGLGDVAAGLVGFDRPFGKAADYLGDKTGLKLTQMANDADKDLSPELQEAKANIPQEGSIGDIASAYLHNPRGAISEGMRSIPMMLGSGLIGKAAGLALPALAGKAMAPARFALGDAALTAGDTMSGIDPNVDPQKAAVASLADGAFTGAVDLASGKLANKLGLENFGNLAAGGGFTKGSKLPAAARILGGTALEAGEEALQNPVDQIAQNAAEGNQWDKGVNRALVGGVAAGGLMGAGSNIASPGTYFQPVLDKRTDKKPADELDTSNTGEEVSPELQAERQRQSDELTKKAKGTKNAGQQTNSAAEAGVVADTGGTTSAVGNGNAERTKATPGEAGEPGSADNLSDKASLIVKANGEPYATETAAKRSSKVRGLDSSHEIIPHEGGFALKPNTTEEPSGSDSTDHAGANGVDAAGVDASGSEDAETKGADSKLAEPIAETKPVSAADDKATQIKNPPQVGGDESQPEGIKLTDKFTATHELSDGTPVIKEDDGSFTDQQGDNYADDGHVFPITKTDTSNNEPIHIETKNLPIENKTDSSVDGLSKEPSKTKEKDRKEAVLEVQGTENTGENGSEAVAGQKQESAPDNQRVGKEDSTENQEVEKQYTKIPEITGPGYDNVTGLIKKSDGNPFDTEAKANQALKNRKNLNPDEHDIVPVDGGFAIAPTKSLSFDQFKALPRNKAHSDDVLAQSYEAETGKQPVAVELPTEKSGGTQGAKGTDKQNLTVGDGNNGTKNGTNGNKAEQDNAHVPTKVENIDTSSPKSQRYTENKNGANLPDIATSTPEEYPEDKAERLAAEDFKSKLYDVPSKKLGGLSVRRFVANHVNGHTGFVAGKDNESGKYWLRNGEAGLTPVTKMAFDYGKAYQQHLYRAMHVYAINKTREEEAKAKVRKDEEASNNAESKDSNEFVSAPDGSKDFGEITSDQAEKMGSTHGKIRLQNGWHDEATGFGYGKVHIDRDLRAEQLAENGYQTSEDLIDDVAKNHNSIYQGKEGTYILAKKNGKAKIAFVKVKKGEDGGFYSVGSGLVSRDNYLKNKPLLWERAQTNQLKESPSAVTGQSNGLDKTIPQSPEKAIGDDADNAEEPKATKGESTLEQQHHVADIYKNGSIQDIEKTIKDFNKRADKLSQQGQKQMGANGKRSTTKATAGFGADNLYGQIQDLEGYLEARKNLTKETDQGTALFSRRGDADVGTVSRSVVDSVIDRVIAASPSHFGREAVVVADTFDDLPLAIRDEAVKQGYDNSDPKDRITGVTYQGKIYIVQGNVRSENEVEETLLHERIHQILHGGNDDPQGKKLGAALNALHLKMGGMGGIMSLADNLGINLVAARKQALKMEPGAARNAFMVDEFLAEAEGRRAYENLPERIQRALSEFYGKFREWLKENGFTRIADKLGMKLDGFNSSDLAYVLRNIRTQDQGKGNNSIRFSRTRDAVDTPQNPLTPDETILQATQRLVQDKMVRFEVIQQKAELKAAKAGGYTGKDIHEARDFMEKNGIHNPISDATNVHQAESLRSGIASALAEDFREKKMKPLIEKAHSTGVTMEEISEFLKIQHAPEANERMRALRANEENPTAFGITDDEAKAAMDAFKARPDYAKLKEIADKWQKLTADILQMKVDEGLIPQSQADVYNATFEMYVPVKGEEGDKPQGTGKGLSVNARDNRRLGHSERDEKIIENIVKDYERTINLVETNKVGKIAGNFIREINDPSIGTLGKPVKRQVFRPGGKHYMVTYHGSDVQSFDNLNDARAFVDAEAQKVDRKKTDFHIDKNADASRVILQAKPLLDDNEFQYYEDGNAIRGQWNDELLAQAYKNLGVDHVNKLLEGAREFNAFLSKAYTGYSPTFLIKNPIRDAIQGMITNTSKLGFGVAAKIFKAYPAALKELSAHFKEHGSSAEVNAYRRSGGSTGASYVSDTERIGSDIMDAYNEYAGAIDTYHRTYADLIAKGRSEKTAQFLALGKAAKSGFLKTPIVGHFLRYMEHANSVTENALRLATFNTLIKETDADGKRLFTNAQAALHAKDLMNFNRKGELTTQAGALYLFFNPNVQGTHVLVTALADSKYKNQARALAGTMVLSAFLLAEAMRGGGDDDEKKWKLISDSVKDRNMIFGSGDTKVMLPIPYGYGVFHALGNAISDVAHGDSAWKQGVRMASSLGDNFSPVGNPVDSTHDAFQLLPTIPKMMMAPSVNENSFGSPISPDKGFNEGKPDSQNMYRNTKGTVYSAIAAGINHLTGGDKYQSGLVDVSPETLKYWMNSLTGGAGQFAIDVINTGMIGMQGTTPEVQEVPVLKSFVHKIGVADARRAFWDAAGKAKKAADAFAMARKAGDQETVKNIMTDNKPLIGLSHMATYQEAMLKHLRDAEDVIRMNDNLSLAMKRLQMKKLEAAENVIYDRFLAAFEQRVH